jgi:hypothetical protein
MIMHRLCMSVGDVPRDRATVGGRMQTLAAIRAAYPLAHPLHRLACMAAQLAEHEAVEAIWVTDDLIDGQVWLGLLLRADTPAGIDSDLRRFAGYATPLLGWKLVEVADVENLASTQLQRAIIWDTERGNPDRLPSPLA